ncbi:MAG: ribonuclease R [Vicinamibacterales bacterium]
MRKNQKPRLRGNRSGLLERLNQIAGRLETTASGVGFVAPEQPIEGVARDIVIPPDELNGALNGDRVVVLLERRRPDGRAEGRVVAILERGASTIVGRFDVEGPGVARVVPFDKRLVADVRIPRGETRQAEQDNMVVVEITQWPTPTRGPIGRVVKVLGDADDPGVDTEVIIHKYQIPDAHSAQSIAEAGRLGDHVRERDLLGRTDFRDRTVVTIDGEHARDFDDAISLSKLPNGHFWLGVHIADVAHYVAEGSALDLEAYDRATSVYFPERAVHMFPAELATGLCSLNPRVDRLVQSCLMEISPPGEIVRYEMHDGVIRSDSRMTYSAVNAILTDRDPAAMEAHRPLVRFLELTRELFEVLNARRRRRGSIDFDLPEAEVVLDEEGFISDIVASERNVAHRLIEEFMLLANETVARHLESHEMPALYRIHEPPDPLKVQQFEEFVSSLGFTLAAGDSAPKPMHFQRLVEKIRDLPAERPIAFLMLRTMQKARYDATNVGHFGLAAHTYTHFTSPIRRYPDLVVHRLLRELRHTTVSAERRAELDDELPEAGRHTSEMERRAVDAERELLQWKKVRFMAKKVGDIFEGWVTGVAPFGLFVELVDHFVEGLVPVATMADDYYRFVEQSHMLFGESTKKTYRLGDRVDVQVVRVDMEKRQIELALEGILDSVRHDDRRYRATARASKPKHAQRKGTPEQRRPRKQRQGKNARQRLKGKK